MRSSPCPLGDSLVHFGKDNLIKRAGRDYEIEAATSKYLVALVIGSHSSKTLLPTSQPATPRSTHLDQIMGSPDKSRSIASQCGWRPKLNMVDAAPLSGRFLLLLAALIVAMSDSNCVPIQTNPKSPPSLSQTGQKQNSPPWLPWTVSASPYPNQSHCQDQIEETVDCGLMRCSLQ